MAKKKQQTVDIDKLLANEDIINVDISQEVRNSTINYAMSVITDRALPDIRDGLKPVQRRILYAAYNKKMLPNTNFVKCAELSGEVMGHYHPHSCLRGDTLVYTTDGKIRTIKELYDITQLNPNVSFEVLCTNKEGKLVVSKMHHVRIGQYTDKIYHILLSNGGELNLTCNHPILLNDLQYKRADEIKIGDELFIGCYNTGHFEVGVIKLFITTIEIEDVNNMPMYDFTVDEYENAMFVVGKDDTVNSKFNKYDMVCLHNSCYGTIANMSQSWNFRYPLMDFHGNNGNLDGLGPAADRYTETKLHKHAMCLLDGIDEDAVDFMPNYSETTTEPTILSGLFPNLLCNGSYGIAVGYTTNFPPHNLNEVVNAIIYALKNDEYTIKDLMKFIKGPDFPLGACLVNNDNIYKLYTEGQASLTFKGKYIIEENEETKNTQIVFTAIPPETKKPKIMEQIHSLCIEKKEIPRVVDVRDESSGASGIRIVVELHKTAIPNIIINELFKRTNLQQNSSYIMRCIDNNTPKLPTLKEIIENYIIFHTECRERQYKYNLSKLQKKLHIQEGYKKVLTDLDSAIKIIRNSDDGNVAKEKLIKKFKLSEEQVQVVLEMKLRSLTKLADKDVNEQIQKLTTNINFYNELLNNKGKFTEQFIEDLENLKKQIGDKRRTEIISESKLISSQDISEDYIIALTNKNNIKHYKEEDFNALIAKTYKDKTEIFKKHFKFNTKNKLLFILEDCTYIVLDFNSILGDLNKILNKQKIIDVIDYNSYMSKVLFIITNKGTVKKVPLDKLKTTGKLYPIIEIKEEQIVNCKLINNTDKEIVTILTDDGKIGRFFAQSFKETNAGGKGLNLSADNIKDFDISETGQYIVVIGSNSISKFNIKDFIVKGRIAKPINAVKSNEMLFIKVTNENIEVINDKAQLKTIPLDKVKVSNKNTKPNGIKDTILFIKE